MNASERATIRGAVIGLTGCETMGLEELRRSAGLVLVILNCLLALDRMRWLEGEGYDAGDDGTPGAST